MSQTTKLYLGGAESGRETNKFLRDFRESRPTDDRAAIFGGREIPAEEDHTALLSTLKADAMAFAARIAVEPLPTDEEYRRDQHRLNSIRMLEESQKTNQERRKVMLKAAEDALAWIAENSGGTIATIVVSWSKAPDAMTKVRGIVDEIKTRFSGIPEQVRGEMDFELNNLAEATTRDDANRLISDIERLRLEIQHHYDDNPEAVAAHELLHPMENKTAVRHLRERLSNESRQLDALRAWFDKKRSVKPTWDKVQKYVVWYCQQHVVTVSERAAMVAKSTSGHTSAASSTVHHVAQTSSVDEAALEERITKRLLASHAVRSFEGGEGAFGRREEYYGAGLNHGGLRSSLPASSPNQCYNFERTGTCSYGDNCRFMHGRSDPRYQQSKKARFEQDANLRTI